MPSSTRRRVSNPVSDSMSCIRQARLPVLCAERALRSARTDGLGDRFTGPVVHAYRHQWKGRPLSTDAGTTLPRLPRQHPAPVRRLQEMRSPKKPGTIQKVAFQGARVTSDAGLILMRELDERLGLEALITDVIHLSEPLLETGERRINADIRPSLQGLRLHLGGICPPSFLASTVSEVHEGKRACPTFVASRR